MGVLGRVLVPALLLRPAAAQPALKFAFDVDVSSWDVWFNQTRDQCNDRDTVDQAMAAFRRDDGSVVAFSGDNDIKANGVPVPGGGFFRMVGSSLHDLVRDCTAPVLKGGPAFADPASACTQPSTRPHTERAPQFSPRPTGGFGQLWAGSGFARTD